MDIDLALKLAQELRGIILKGFKADQDKEAYEKSDKSISDFFKEENVLMSPPQTSWLKLML